MDADDPDVTLDKPVNKTPEFLQDAISTVFIFLQNYGWYVFITLIVIYYLKGKFGQRIHQWRSSRIQDNNLHRYDDGTVLSRHQAMEESRRRMQEQLNAQAALYAEQQRMKEEEKRRQKIEDWDRHLEGKGYKSKYRPVEENVAAARPSTSSSQTKKKTYRTNDYNPLTGGDSCSNYRPERRGGATGGGG